MNIGLAMAIAYLWPLWEKLFKTNWAEIVVPTVAPVDGQFIGFLIPTDAVKSDELLRYTDAFQNDPQCEVGIVTKPFGKRNRACLSVLFRFETYLNQNELGHAAESLRNQIRLTFGVPSLTIRLINSRDAERRLC